MNTQIPSLARHLLCLIGQSLGVLVSLIGVLFGAIPLIVFFLGVSIQDFFFNLSNLKADLQEANDGR